MLCGDFNACNPWCGSAHLDAKERVIGSLLEATDSVLLNDDSVIKINNNGTFSPLDLTLVSSDQLPAFLVPETYCSKHILVKIGEILRWLSVIYLLLSYNYSIVSSTPPPPSLLLNTNRNPLVE